MPQIPTFPHQVGMHCSSTSVQNVLRYDGIDLSEAMVFGLGSGLGFFYIFDPAASPTHVFNGRSANLEGNFYQHIGQPLKWEKRWNPQTMAAVLANGRPILAQSDIFYLPYYQPAVHFIGHGIVITGIDLDAQTANIADIADDALLTVSLANLQAALQDERPPLLRPYHWTQTPHLTTINIIPENLITAILATCSYMLTPPSPQEGLPAMQQMAYSLPHWHEMDDWAWAARFGYQAIEKRGTGGGGFRHLYADFLHEAATYLPALINTNAAVRFHKLGIKWSEFAQRLKAVFVEQNPGHFEAAALVLAEIVEEETAVLQTLQELF